MPVFVLGARTCCSSRRQIADARAFYERHGLIVERRVDGPSHYKAAMSLDLDSPPQVADALLMRFTKNR